jgi:hypothetical protein
MSKQTAVEWLMPNILELSLLLSLRRISQRNCELKMLKLFDQAKAMEREQIEDAWCDGNDSEPKEITGDYAEQYYNETYGGDK